MKFFAGISKTRVNFYIRRTKMSKTVNIHIRRMKNELQVIFFFFLYPICNRNFKLLNIEANERKTFQPLPL